MPTKATLFGLDVRFREIDRKIAEEKERKNASSIKLGSSIKDKLGSVKVNRHLIPPTVNPSTI